MLGILGGRVYDPRNGKDGEIGDIWVKDGRIVAPEDVDREMAQTVDATGLVVMPGGVDIHAHIVGGEVNSGRKLQPEDHRGHERARSGNLRAGAGGIVPSTHLTGYLYSELGYTTVMQASAAPLAVPARSRRARGRAEHRQGRAHRDGQQPLRHAVHRRRPVRQGA